MVTIRMIAEKCGCSTATVSKALNSAPDVSAETAQRIRKAAIEMGYTPNAAARALKTSRSHTFGVLFKDATNSGLTHEFFSTILNSFKRRAEELGYDICFITERLGRQELTYVEHARYRNCDGVLIATVEYTEPAVTELMVSDIPVVAIDYVHDNCGSVQSDNPKGMADLVHYIYSMGHRKIAFIHGEETAVTKLRVASFYRTCRELGLEIPEEYVVSAFYHDPGTSGRLTRQLLEGKDPPTCIIYPDDISYIGGMYEIEKMGLSIPDDISTVGYDGIKLSQLFRPKLTTLHQSAEEMGIRAAEELSRAVEEGKLYIPNRIMIPGSVYVGGTVKKIQ